MIEMAKDLLRPAVKSYREAVLHWDRVRQDGAAPRAVIFPNQIKRYPASFLRGYAIADEMRRIGWRVSVAHPSLTLHQRQRLLRLERPDAVLLQQIYNPMNDPALYPGYRCFIDIDDAVFEFPDLTRRFEELCRAADGIIAGSEYIRAWCSQFNRNAHVVWTCTPVPDTAAPSSIGRRPIVAWAHSAPLAFPDEAELVRDIMLRVLEKTQAELWLYGRVPDEKREKFLSQYDGIPVRFFPFMSYDDYLDSLGHVAVGLQVLADSRFARGRSFGKVLAYLQQNVAVVCTGELEHAKFFQHGVNGMLADSVDEYASSIVRLLDDPDLRETLTQRAQSDFRRPSRPPSPQNRSPTSCCRKDGPATARGSFGTRADSRSMPVDPGSRAASCLRWQRHRRHAGHDATSASTVPKPATRASGPILRTIARTGALRRDWRALASGGPSKAVSRAPR